MNIDDQITKLQNLSTEYRKARNIIGEEIWHIAYTSIIQIMYDCGIEGISWQQYTPYFMDGEACHFGVYFDEYTSYVQFSPNSGWYNYDDDEYHNFISPVIKKGLDSIYRILDKIPNEVFEYQFGDHVDVFITKSQAARTETCDHD